MKKALFFFTALIFICKVYSQQAAVTWGEEFKLSKGSTDLAVVCVDKSGVFLKESHMVLKSYFVVGYSSKESAQLIKLDKSLKEVYRNDFHSELKGKDFDQFFVLQNKLFMTATDYVKKDKTLTLYAVEIDKGSGKAAGEWREIANWQKDEKSDNIRFKVSYNADSSHIVIVSSVAGVDRNNYQVMEYDNNLKLLNKPVSITNEFDAKTFQLEDVLYTALGRVVMVGRIYEYEEGKKKKDKFLDFKNYTIRIYDNQGKLIKDVNTDVSGKWLVSSKVMQEEDKDLVLAAVFSNERKGKEINGLLVQRINPSSGEVVSTNQSEINTSLITEAEEDANYDKKEKEKLDKLKNDEQGFSKDLRFRNIFYTPDNGLVILAERFNKSYYTSNSTQGGFNYSDSYEVYSCGDLMMSKIDSTGKISWLKILPKAQKEVISTGSSTSPASGGLSVNVGSNYFGGFNRPFYGGFNAMMTKNIDIIFNDNRENVGILQLGQKVKSTSNFNKSDCFMVTLDPRTGKLDRKMIFSNGDVPTAMPRLGSVEGNEMYIIGKEDRFLAKTKIAVAKIQIKN